MESGGIAFPAVSGITSAGPLLILLGLVLLVTIIASVQRDREGRRRIWFVVDLTAHLLDIFCWMWWWR